MKKLNLSQLALSNKRVEFDFPGMEGFKVSLAYQSRNALEKLRDDSTVQKVDAESGLPYQDLDRDLYVKNYVARTVLGWKGFKMEYLAKLILIDETQIEDMNEEIEFEQENAVYLVTNSERFDTWITSTLRKLDNFRSSKN